jgi:hypothetical protein
LAITCSIPNGANCPRGAELVALALRKILISATQQAGARRFARWVTSPLGISAALTISAMNSSPFSLERVLSEFLAPGRTLVERKAPVTL